MGVDLLPPKLSIDQLAAEWLDQRGRQLADGTLRDYESVIETHILPRIGGLNASGLRTANVRSWMAELDKAGVSIDRQRRALKMLRMLLRFGVESDYLTVNVASNVRMPKKPMSEPVRPLSPKQIESLRAYLRGQGLYADALLICIMGYAGLRPGEASALTWADVRERTLIVRATKTSRVRSVQVLEPLAQDLAEYALATGRPSGLIYPRPRAGEWTRAATRAWRNDVFKPAIEKCKIDATPYALRHSFASLLIHAHYPVTYVAEQLGHSPTMTMTTYAHVIADLDPAERIEPAEAILAARSGLKNGHGERLGSPA